MHSLIRKVGHVFIKHCRCMGGQYEGFAYLGAGCLLLLIFSAFSVVYCIDLKRKMVENRWKIIGLVLTALIAFIVALSPIITVNDKVIHEFNFPPIITDVWSIFRASGRVSWVSVYIIMLSSCIILFQIMDKKTIILLMVVSVILQAYDIHKILLEKNDNFNQIAEYNTSLHEKKFWDAIGTNNEIKNIVFTSSIDIEELYLFTDWALNNQKTVSSFYFARSYDEKINDNLKVALEKLSSNDIFIFSESNKLNCAKYNLNFYQVDGYVIGYNGSIGGWEPVSKSDLLSVSWTFGYNQYIQNGEDIDGVRYLYPTGLSYGPYWDVPEGNYIATINGKELKDANFIVYSKNGELKHDFQIVDKSEDSVTLLINLAEKSDNLEILIQNNTNKTISLRKIELKYSSESLNFPTNISDVST